MIRLAELALVATVAGLLPALSARAADEGAHGGGADFWWNLLNFLLLIGVLVYFGRAPIKSRFAERRRDIASDLDASQRLLSEAEERLSTWQHRVDQLDAELASIRRTARARAEAEREQIVASAHASAERIRRDAEAAVAQELRRARAQLREEAAALAVELAGDLLHEKVTAADRDRLVDDFIERVSTAPGAASRATGAGSSGG